ncbi:signal peptidase II [candidate division KSB1 bacterium]|nr:MAG: signal peptidase II [candidate division KSB1 bacterium]
MSRRRPVWPWYTGIAGLLILDQWTKILVRRHIPLHDSIPVIGKDFLRLTHVQNPGVVFGADFIGGWPLMLFGWVAAAVMVFYLYRLVRRKDILRWPVALFLAGAVGNSIDRLLFGQVTDFIDVDFPDFIMERWAVFNIADSCITVGIVILISIILFHPRGKLHPSAAESDAPPSPESQTVSSDHSPRPTETAD